MMPWTRPAHLAYVWRINMATVLAWSVGGAIATYFDPRWPTNQAQWIDFAIVIYIVQFLAIKSFLMWARTRVWQRLGASLIAVNVAFAVLYLAAILFTLWPALAGSAWVRRGLRGEVALAVTWSGLELIWFSTNGEQALPKLTIKLTILTVAATLFFLWRAGFIGR